MESVAGRSYGPIPVAITADRVVDFVAASGDDPELWSAHAPPAYAAALLFAVAPRFLADDDVAPLARSVIHTEQRFEWMGPIAIGGHVVSASVGGVRRRGDLVMVEFEAEVSAGGEPVVRSNSTFLMSPGEAAKSSIDEEEPDVDEKGPDHVPALVSLPAPGNELPALHKSVSRSGLVRYAAATGDWNPIHWDHARALDAGLPGVVAHGLLMMAWAAQAVGRTSNRPDPLVSLSVRFRKPLRPGVAATVTSAVADDGDGGFPTITLAVVAGENRCVVGQGTVRTE